MKGSTMKRNSILKALNPVLALLFCSLAGSGIFHAKLSHETFEVMHEGCGIAFLGLAILHLILNWNWIKANYFGK